MEINTPKRFLSAMLAGTFDDMYAQCPEELQVQLVNWKFDILDQAHKVLDEVLDAYQQAPISSKKEFALWVKANYPHYAAYLFGVWDGKEVFRMILEKENFNVA